MNSSTCDVHTNFEMRVSNVHGQIRVSDHLPAMLAQDMEHMVSWRGMKRHKWTMNNHTCHVRTT